MDGGQGAKEERRDGNSANMCVSMVSDVCHQLKPPVIITVLKPGLIDQANGSAYIETEKTKIACAVSVASLSLRTEDLNMMVYPLHSQVRPTPIEKCRIQREREVERRG